MHHTFRGFFLEDRWTSETRRVIQLSCRLTNSNFKCNKVVHCGPLGDCMALCSMVVGAWRPICTHQIRVNVKLESFVYASLLAWLVALTNSAHAIYMKCMQDTIVHSWSTSLVVTGCDTLAFGVCVVKNDTC